MSTNTTVAKATHQKTIRQTLAGDYFRQQVAMALPKHMTADRFIRVALNTVMRTPKLAECSEASLLLCLLNCSALGLEPDGRRAHLIPFENRKMGTVECTLIVDWKGIAELALRSGIIGKLHADLICDNDEFAYDLGDILHHKIDFKKPRGNPYAAYALAVTKDGQKFVTVMTKDEIEKIRDNSQGWRAFKAGFAKQSPWQDSPGEMWKKTAFKRLSKWLPLSPEIQDAMDKDEIAPMPKAAILTTESLQLQEPAAIEIEAPQEQAAEDTETPASEPEPPTAPATPRPPRGAAATAASAKAELENVVTQAGFTFDQFIKWAGGSGSLENADFYTCFDDMKSEDCQRLLRAKTVIVNSMNKAKEGGQL